MKYLIIILILLSLPLKAQLVEPVVAVTGSVYDAITKEAVAVFIVVFDESGKKINQTKSNAAQNGYYYLPSLKSGAKYTVQIAHPNYLKEKIEIQIPKTKKYEEISRDFLVKPIEKGVKIPINVPPFELNKSKLRFGSNVVLEALLGTLTNNPTVKFEIQCFPDNNDNKDANLTLTEERCKSLNAYFASKGIDANRITIKGSNSTDPKNPPPAKKKAKGKRYIGSSYIVITDF